MPFRRTSSVTIDGATVGTDDYGDETETWRTTSTVGAHLFEYGSTHLEPVSGRWTDERRVRGLFDPGTVLNRGDRVTVDGDGTVYTVTHVYELDESPVGIVPTRAELERITG